MEEKISTQPITSAKESGEMRIMNLETAQTQCGDTYLSDTSEAEIKEPVPLWERRIFTVPFTNWWPGAIPCQMNIPVWVDLMTATGLEREIPYIVNGFKHGFCLGIPQHNLEGMRW